MPSPFASLADGSARPQDPPKPILSKADSEAYCSKNTL